MNEHEWKKARDPEAMLAAVQDRLSQRKWVLLSCAVARSMMLKSHSYYLQRLDDYERSWETQSKDLFEEVRAWDNFRRLGDKGEMPSPDVPSHSKDSVARRYSLQALYYRNHYLECRTEIQTTIASFASTFPNVTRPEETWERCRVALSIAAYAAAREMIYLEAEHRVLGNIEPNTLSYELPEQRNKAEVNIRAIQKQLVLDMNKAMRNYAKPANELLAHFLHEQLGNPYQPYEFDPAWRTSDVMGLAKSIEADRGFDRMNMLADALMEAGCEQEAMLLHLQEEREHQRGCWVLDLILGHDTEMFARPPLEDVSGTGGRHEPLGLAMPRNWDV